VPKVVKDRYLNRPTEITLITAVVLGLHLLSTFEAIQAADDSSSSSVEEFQERAVDELQTALKNPSHLVKLHAAEALLALGYGEKLHAIFENELKQDGDRPRVRIGIWRVLARTEVDKSLRVHYLSKLCETYLDPNSPDGIDAAEALAKLSYEIPVRDRPRFISRAQRSVGLRAPYCRWLMAVSGTDQDVRFLADLLDDRDAEVRGLTAYALRHLSDKLPLAVVAKLANTAIIEPESEHRVYLISAAYVTSRDTEQLKNFEQLLTRYAREGSGAEKYEAAVAVGIRGSNNDAPQLIELLSDRDANVRVAAANAVLRIERRKPLPFAVLDWTVLAAYGVGMLAIGWHFSRRTDNTDDYLLAGRRMKPWAVGLSYFAGMFSTITYLAMPGEMIRHGPMILSTVLAYPLIFVVVGRWLIPYIMRIKVTSAYEILEKRFGLSVRLLGATFFMVLRLIWMAFIVFATSKHVLAPLLGFDDSATPWIAIVLGLVTVTYTSMGGLRAVIWTDVAQTFILMFGAILSIVMISISLGGPAGWWPSSWSSDWEAPKFWFDPTARVTMASAILSTFVWHICTAGSDQMAVQRYLATRDARSARRMFGFSLCCDVLVVGLLAGLGLALFSYFQTHPQMLPDGQTVVSGADRLLPRYIVKGLPVGISGLIVAGLLAAAMSSLSSGLNATCSVIMVDWIDRFRKTRNGEVDQVRTARFISCFIGAVVVSLSLASSLVRGNLLEAANRLVNLLTAPLFVLFFMAMFVRWATPFGTWAAGLSSVAAAAVIAYTDLTPLSFLWIMPSSLVTGVVVGCLVSVIPITKRRPMLEISKEVPPLAPVK
jgi:solute:Na+ symporter, SSS family